MSKLGPCQGKRDGTEVGMYGGVGGAVSGDDDVLGGPDGETGGDDGVGCMGQVICIYPYVPFMSFLLVIGPLTTYTLLHTTICHQRNVGGQPHTNYLIPYPGCPFPG